MQETHSTAKNICQLYGKSSVANAAALSSLFPNFQRKKQKFNPHDECVVAQQHRKKKAGKPKDKLGRAKNVKVVLVEMHNVNQKVQPE